MITGTLPSVVITHRWPGVGAGRSTMIGVSLSGWMLSIGTSYHAPNNVVCPDTPDPTTSRPRRSLRPFRTTRMVGGPSLFSRRIDKAAPSDSRRRRSPIHTPADTVLRMISAGIQADRTQRNIPAAEHRCSVPLAFDQETWGRPCSPRDFPRLPFTLQ